MRRNIFDILSENFDITQEIKLIWQLFEKDVSIFMNKDALFETCTEYSILGCVEEYAFDNWKSRNRCISPLDMIERLGINENMIMSINNFSDELLMFLEFILNMIMRCDIAIKQKQLTMSSNYQILKENIVIFIEHFGYTTHYLKDVEQVIIIEKNPAVISVSEISEPEICKKIIQYNHYTLKGNIDAKKDIIIALANEIEPQRKEMEKINSSIESDLFFLLNNMNIRHNNIEPKNTNYKPFVAKMSKSVLEHWYDEVYQLILLAKLLLDNVKRQNEIKTLKSKFDDEQ
jgi:hypothetical protein